MALYVNGELIEEVTIFEEAERLRPEYERVFTTEDPDQVEANEKQLMEWSKENVIERVLMRQAAINDPEPIDPEHFQQAYDHILEQAGGEEQFIKDLGIEPSGLDAVKKDIENELKLQRLVNSITEKAPTPTEKELITAFESDPQRFTIPEMVRASHIVKHHSPEVSRQDALKEMQEVLKEVRESDNFAEIASKYSSCPDDGGDLGFFPRGQMVQEFEDIVFNMQPGQISDVFETQFGFHIATVTEKRDSIPCKFEDVKEVLEKELTEAAQQRELEKFVDAQKEKAKIEEKNIIIE